MLISVVIPIYNVEKYLERCLNSIMNQTYRELEVLLIDDGSTDHSAEIARRFENKDPRFHFWGKVNGGLSSARNYGIERATGEYISFIDSDDYIEPDFFGKLFEACTGNGSDISMCGFVKKGENVPELVYNAENSLLSQKDAMEWLDKRENFEYVQMVVAWNKLYKKDIFQTIRYPEKRIHEDEFVIVDVLLKANKISVINEPLYIYWQRNDSIIGSSSLNDTGITDLIKAYEHRTKLFFEQKYNAEFLISWRNCALTMIEHMYKEEKKGIKRSQSAIYGVYKNWLKSYKSFLPVKIKYKYSLFLISKKLYVFLFGIRDV